MYRGYVKLWRKLEDSQIFQNEKALKIWIWFLLRANHEEKDVLIGRKIIKIRQGEFMTSFPHLQEDLHFAMSTIHFWIKQLEQLGMVESKKTNKFTLIKIKNWEDYQDTESQKKANESSKRKLKETNNTLRSTKKNDKETISEPSSPQINELFKILSEINETINYGNTTQRKAADRLIKRIGAEKALGSARAAVASFGKQYAPTITTPIQLENKLAELVAFYKKQEKSNITIAE